VCATLDLPKSGVVLDTRGVLTPSDFLAALRARGATRLAAVRFRNNRSTVWSLTQRGTVLNVHAAFREAPPGLLDAFATLAAEGGIGSRQSRRAAAAISGWPRLKEAIDDARRAHEGRRTAGQADGPCCATPGQRAYVLALYRYFNHTRFDGRLPSDIPVRLSRRMTSALGHMRPGSDDAGQRRVSEIALNVDLMLEGNGAERADTLLHEMAHAADYIESGHRGHGSSWRAWAHRVGCRATTLLDRPVHYRGRRDQAVTRVPPLPPALLEL